ncbi:uncharacterized protein [Argopecten irradians]|uniref:uncharacterized protein n=1 Tax=Argopecten irradians TaxID=31199 RepID=UPI003714CB70
MFIRCTFILLCWVPLLISSQTTAPRMIPAVLGSSVTLDCTVSPSPDSFMIWEKTSPTKIVIAINEKLQSGFQNSSKVSVLLRADNTTSLELKSMGLMEDGQYRCYDVIDLLTVDRFDVTILVRPNDIGVSSLTGQIDEGTQETVTCVADGGKPSPSIEWYLLGPEVNRTRLLGTEDTKQYPNGTWYKRSSLTFTVTRLMYRGSLVCLVNTGPIPFYNESFQTQLDVNLAPLVPSISYFTGLFNNGETKTITCTSAGSRPAATINWYVDGAKLSNTVHEVLPRSDGTFFVTGLVTVTFDKSMSGHRMRCAASNSVIQNNGIGEVNRSLTLLVTYPPEITSENGTREVTEDSDIVLTCLVDARPMPIPQNIFWRHNNNIISTGTGSRFNYTTSRIADLHISSVKREDAGDYVCQALNTIGVGSGQKVYIDVSYRPFCTQSDIVKHAVKLGGSVTVTCTVDGNPGNSTIKWRYKGTGITINPTGSTRTVYGRPRETSSTAVISVKNEWQYTDVECVGTNAIGVSRSPCIYRIVRPGPPEVPINCSWSSMNDAEIRVQCSPGFDGGSGQLFVLQQSESGGQYENSLNDTTPKFLVSHLKAGTRYSFKICATSDLYPDLLSCSSEIAAQTSKGSTGQQAIASAGSPDSAPYIAAGVMGAVVLFILIGIIIFFVRKRRQVRKPYDHDSQLAASAAHRMYRDQVIDNDGHDNYGNSITSTTHGHYSTSSHSLPSRRELENSFYGHDPTKTIRKSVQWNNKQLLYYTSKSKQGGVSHVTSTSNGSDNMKNTNVSQNSYLETSNNQVILAERNESFVIHMNPNNIKNIDCDSNSISDKMIAYDNQLKLTQEDGHVSNYSHEQAKSEDDFDVNDFQNWLKGTPSNFGRSSRHNLCYSEADISMATIYPKPSNVDSKKSVSLEVIPRTNESELDNTGLCFYSKPQSHLITMENCLEENENSSSSSVLLKSQENTPDTVMTDHVHQGSGTDPADDSFGSSESKKSPFKRSSYKLAMCTNDDFALHDFFSASVEALAALDATLAYDATFDHESDSSESFKSSSNNVGEGDRDQKEPSEDNNQDTPTEQEKRRPMIDTNVKTDKSSEEDYVEMSLLSGKPDEAIEPIIPVKVCIEMCPLPEKEKNDKTSTVPDKLRYPVETATIPEKHAQVTTSSVKHKNNPSISESHDQPSASSFTQDYIDMSTIPCKQDNKDANASEDKGGKDESNGSPTKRRPVEKIRLRCKRVITESPTLSTRDSSSSSSSESSESSSSESDSEKFTTPKESRDLDSVLDVSSNQHTSDTSGKCKSDKLPCIDSSNDSDSNSVENTGTSPVYF